MRRRVNLDNDKVISISEGTYNNIGIVLSGGGARAAYQVGVLKALIPFFKKHPKSLNFIFGSSIGSINGIILGETIHKGFENSINLLEKLWLKRTYRNTFSGSATMAFLKTVRVALLQYINPGPNPTDNAIFDPTPLKNEIRDIIDKHSSSSAQNQKGVSAIGVMTTIEGENRKPLLFVKSNDKLPISVQKSATFDTIYVDRLNIKHGFASAALPSILPPVEIDTKHGRYKLIDGGISQNIPVDPAARFGAEKVIVIDISGREFWHKKLQTPSDRHPSWEVPANFDTFCIRPPDSILIQNKKPLGKILEESIGSSNSKFISAIGPTWPLFSLLKNKIGTELAYEFASYVALDPDYITGVVWQGYSETISLIRSGYDIHFKHNKDYKKMIEDLNTTLKIK